MPLPITKLVQISDTHLLADESQKLRGCNPLSNLQALLLQVKAHHPDRLLLTGDLAETGDFLAYQHLQKTLAPLQMPVDWLPGNHDNLGALQASFSNVQPFSLASAGWVVDLSPWRLLLLNSVLESAKFGEGLLSSTSLEWLHQQLQQFPQQHTAIALHHHPVPTGIDWLDLMQVQNADAFLEILREFTQVHLVLFGHIHLDFHLPYPISAGNQINFYGCPATTLQVTPLIPTADSHLPGFRLLTLYPDGSYETCVERLRWQD